MHVTWLAINAYQYLNFSPWDFTGTLPFLSIVVTVGFDQSSYSVTEFQDSQLDFNVQILSGQKGPGRSCVVTISTLPDSATCKYLFSTQLYTDWYKLIGASVSEPLSSDLNVNFVCLSVCLSVCHGSSTYRKSLPALILRVCVML